TTPSPTRPVPFSIKPRKKFALLEKPPPWIPPEFRPRPKPSRRPSRRSTRPWSSRANPHLRLNPKSLRQHPPNTNGSKRIPKQAVSLCPHHGPSAINQSRQKEGKARRRFRRADVFPRASGRVAHAFDPQHRLR